MGQYDKRNEWSMAELAKDEMLEDEMAKDKMGADEVGFPYCCITALNFWTFNLQIHFKICFNLLRLRWDLNLRPITTSQCTKPPD